jgi:hypothetical protein
VRTPLRWAMASSTSASKHINSARHRSSAAISVHSEAECSEAVKGGRISRAQRPSFCLDGVSVMHPIAEEPSNPMATAAVTAGVILAWYVVTDCELTSL